jgi:hypothetical protein
MPTPTDLDATSSDLEVAKAESRTKLKLLESTYRRNQIDAIMEMGAELSLLHRKYSAAGCRRQWKTEYCDLQLRMSRRTAERYRKLYNAFYGSPNLWENFKLGAMVLLAEFAEKVANRQTADEPKPDCLLHIKTLAVNWDGVIRRKDAELYCQAWERFADRPELLKWFTFEALTLLVANGTEEVIGQAKFAANDLEQDAAAGNVAEPIGVDQVQAIIENFTIDEVLKVDSAGQSDAEVTAGDADLLDDQNLESDGDSETGTPDGDDEEEHDHEASSYDAQGAIESQPTSSRKFVKTYKLSKCDISIASDIGPVTPDDIESILDELRTILQGEFEHELSTAI